METVEHVSANPPELSQALYEELVASIRGGVYPREDSNFLEYSKMFNGNVKTTARVVVCPVEAEDVSKILLFCVKHSLSLSVKAGGYGIAGWAIAGDVIIDMSKLIGVDIEQPHPGGGYTSLRDMAPLGSKSKDRVCLPENNVTSSTHGKRRREDDDKLRIYDAASGVVASFLHGPPISSQSLDGPSASVRRRLDDGSAAVPESRQVLAERPSETISNSDNQSQGPSRSQTLSSREETSTNETLPSLPAGSSGADPFGYMDLGSNNMYQPSSSSHSIYRPSGRVVGASESTAGLMASIPNQLIGAAPVHPHAFVTFGAGMRQKEIDRYTAEHPLEAKSLSGFSGLVPYHVPFSAHPVGSSIMLLGGFGFQSRLRGLSVDNLVEVEMVLADGRIVIVNETEHPDLWFAIRGGGPAFGIAIRYKAKAYPVPVVFAGNLIYRFHRATAPSLIKHFRDCIKGAPRELYANVLLTAGPAGEDSLVVIQICYLGPKEQGQEYLQAISSWEGEGCLLNEVDEKSFLNQQDSVAQVLRGKVGRQWFIRSALITSLPDDIIHETVLQFSTSPVGCTWLFELAGGGISDYEDTCIPKSQREASFTVAALHQWEMGALDDRCRSAAEDWISGTLVPVNQGGPYPTFLARHEPPARTMACYGDNWSRLVEIKQKYDPSGLFRNTFWPVNVQGQTIEPEQHEPASP